MWLEIQSVHEMLNRKISRKFGRSIVPDHVNEEEGILVGSRVMQL